jgi:transcriptional regulator with XRE-family HTH domain
MIKSEQLRAGRALLGMSQADVAAAAGVSVPTVKRLESGKGPSVTVDARGKVATALEGAGVIFQPENGEGPGARLRKVKP